MTEPHLPGIPDKHGDVEYEQLPEGTQEVNSEPVLSLKTSELTRDESSGALRAWLSEELHRHNAAICKHLDEAFDRQLKSQRSAFEKQVFRQNIQGLNREQAELHTDLRLAGLCLPPEPKQPDREKVEMAAGPEHTQLTGPTGPMNPPALGPTCPMEPTKPASPTVPAEPKTESAPVLPHAVTPPKNPGEGQDAPPILQPSKSKTSSTEGSSSIRSMSADDIQNSERRPSRMQEAWNEAQMQEQKETRRASQMLGSTYNKLVTRVEIDFKESVVDAVVSFLVVLYTFILLLQTQWRGFQAAQRLNGVDPTDPDFQDWPGAETAFFIVDHIFNAIFVLEIAWRLYMHKLQFLCDIFGVFDVLVVIATSIDVYVLQPFDAGYAQNFAVGRLTRIFRLMRIFRVLRVMRFAKNLQQLRLLGDVLSKCLSPLMWALLVLGIIMVGTGVLMSQLLVEYVLDTSQDLDKRLWVYEYYGTALKATYSVFEATFSGSWPLLARNLIRDVSEWYCIFWIAYQVVIGFAVMRVIGALFLNETIRAANSDGEAEVLRKMKEKEAFSQKVYQFFTAADASGDGRLSYEELEAALQEPGVEAWLKALELEIHEAYTLFSLLDDDRDGEISYEEFLHSALRLKGNARAIDSIMIMHEQAKMGDEIKRLRNMMVSSFDEASKSREQFHASAQAQQAQQAQQFPTHHERRPSRFGFGDLLLSPTATKAKLAQRRASEVHIRDLRRPSELD